MFSHACSVALAAALARAPLTPEMRLAPAGVWMLVRDGPPGVTPWAVVRSGETNAPSGRLLRPLLLVAHGITPYAQHHRSARRTRRTCDSDFFVLEASKRYMPCHTDRRDERAVRARELVDDQGAGRQARGRAGIWQLLSKLPIGGTLPILMRHVISRRGASSRSSSNSTRRRTVARATPTRRRCLPARELPRVVVGRARRRGGGGATRARKRVHVGPPRQRPV